MEFISNIIDFIKSLNLPSLAVAVVLSTIITIYVNRLLTRGEKKKMGQESKLKVHFHEELEPEANLIIRHWGNLMEDCGLILVKGVRADKPANTVIMLPQPSFAFAAHFPKETAELKRLAGLITEHYSTRGKLISEIGHYLKLLGFTTGPNREMNISPFIYDRFFDILFLHWTNTPEDEYATKFDFRNIETRPDGPNALFVSGSAIAYAATEVDKEVCRHRILEISENSEYKNKAVAVLDTANSLIAESASVCQYLGNKVADVAKYWPGTKVYKFKIEKKACPICKKVFD
ncbi:MAG: hypothetical protein MUO89_04795 [Dehalococcoidia bacterium]|nr:hypothetical protein [Dehalococcoidia bacterium]